MLVGFEYFDNKLNVEQLTNYQFTETEIELSREFVTKNPWTPTREPRCPACYSGKSNTLFEQWGVPFQMCERCWTTFIPIDPELSYRFEYESEVAEFRRTDSFQDASAQQRKMLWDNMLDWISYRTFKYLKRNNEMTILDLGNRFRPLSEAIRSASMTGEYRLAHSILNDKQDRDNIQMESPADLVLMVDMMQHWVEPDRYLAAANRSLKENGLLFLTMKLGTGFDILALHGNVEGIFPYEHVFLPSRNIVTDMFARNGFSVLEMVTPGVMDIPHVVRHPERLRKDDLFFRYLIESGNEKVFEDFQKFLQRHGYSSYVQIVSQKSGELRSATP